MAVNDIFKKVPVEIPNRSGFDMSSELLGTSKVGTLVPVHTDFLLPNDTVTLGVSAEVQLPPMATDFYGRVKMHFETFFCPCRLLYGGWQDLVTRNTNNGFGTTAIDENTLVKFLPSLRFDSSDMGPGSLSDYLGYGFKTGASTSPLITVPNPLKYCAYHRIWNDFYRDSRIQKPAFTKSISNGQTPEVFMYMPYYSYPGNSAQVLTSTNCNDNIPAYALRQRNFGKDYFTNSTPLPQAGSPASVAFGISNNQGAFTIASLRAANALQTWLERNNVAGFRYGDQIRAQFGVYPSDAALDRPLYLGRQIVDVYNKTVFQNDGNTSSSNSNNPFSTVGSKYGSPLGVGSGSLCDTFTAKEHGYLMTIASLVPDSLYSDTIDPDFWYSQYGDFPWPLLQGVGDQPVSLAELVGYLAATDINNPAQTVLLALKAQVFGYTQRYANHKFKLDRVVGLLKSGESLDSFALQRTFLHSTQNPLALGSSFLQIPVTYLDDVAAVQGDVSKYGCWFDLFFKYHKVSTLAAYSIPTLGEPKNTHTELIDNGGFRL